MPQPYNPNDPVESAFLTALSSNEGNALYEGYKGIDLTNYPKDQYGFPIWPGVTDASTLFKPTHAAGFFQFEPGTFDSVAAANPGISFDSLQGQQAAAWLYAQDTFSKNTGGDLYTTLKQGNNSAVQKALINVWPSVNKDNLVGTGSVSAPTPQTQTGIPWVDSILNSVGDIVDYPAALATAALGGNTTPTPAQGPNGPATTAGADTGKGINQVAQDVTGALFTGIIAWFSSHWIEVTVIGGAVVLVFVSLGGAFHSDAGGKTTIVPIPV